jgi:hypothetical protein
VTIFHAVLLLATFLCSLVAGLLFAFAAVVMPGIRSLDDGGFIRAFQVIDRVIQNNQPLFVFVWVGSVLSLIAAAVLGIWALNGADRLLIIVAALLYLLCVQLPDFRDQHSLEQPGSEAGPRLDERDDAKTCAGGIRAPLEPMERNQDRVCEPRVHLVDDSLHEGVSAVRFRTGSN